MAFPKEILTSELACSYLVTWSNISSIVYTSDVFWSLRQPLCSLPCIHTSDYRVIILYEDVWCTIPYVWMKSSHTASGNFECRTLSFRVFLFFFMYCSFLSFFVRVRFQCAYFDLALFVVTSRTIGAGKIINLNRHVSNPP